MLLPSRSFAEQTVSDWLGVANAQLAQGKPGRALLIFGEIASRHPEFSPAQAGLQQSFRKLGSVRRNEAFLRYALAKDPKHEDALLAAWQALDRAHPLRFSGPASILPSSNVDHVASERYLVTDFGTFLIDGGGNETTGVGLGYGAISTISFIPGPAPGPASRRLFGGVVPRAHPALMPSLPRDRLRASRPSRAPWSLEAFVSRRRYGGTALDITADNSARGLDSVRLGALPVAGGPRLRLGGGLPPVREEALSERADHISDLSRADAPRRPWAPQLRAASPTCAAPHRLSSLCWGQAAGRLRASRSRACRLPFRSASGSGSTMPPFRSLDNAGATAHSALASARELEPDHDLRPIPPLSMHRMAHTVEYRALHNQFSRLRDDANC